MSVRVLVNGARGKMGQPICDALRASSQFELIYGAGREDDLSRLLTELKPDIAIDVTNATVAYDNAKLIIAHEVRAVIGTSGLQAGEIAELTQRCEKNNLGGIIAPNFSVGAVMMMKLSALLAPHFPDVEIIETHHPEKIDSPSGTALKTAEMINKARNKISNAEHSDKEQKARGARCSEVNIHAVRLPGFVASQEVIFGGLGEHVSVKHSSISRASFMPGVLLACEQVMRLNRLVYGLEHLI